MKTENTFNDMSHEELQVAYDRLAFKYGVLLSEFKDLEMSQISMGREYTKKIGYLHGIHKENPEDENIRFIKQVDELSYENRLLREENESMLSFRKKPFYLFISIVALASIICSFILLYKSYNSTNGGDSSKHEHSNRHELNVE